MKYKLTLLGLLFSFFVVAQSKNQTAVIDVDGVCGMCKSRIEKACLQTKGVKLANWNVETHQLKLIFNNQKSKRTLILFSRASNLYIYVQYV